MFRDRMYFLVKDPHWTFLWWEFSPATVERLMSEAGHAVANGRFTLRIHDVTHVIFDGFNSHWFFDVAVRGYTDHWYLRVPQSGRVYCAEAGVSLPDMFGSHFANSLQGNLLNTKFIARICNGFVSRCGAAQPDSAARTAFGKRQLDVIRNLRHSFLFDWTQCQEPVFADGICRRSGSDQGHPRPEVWCRLSWDFPRYASSPVSRGIPRNHGSGSGVDGGRDGCYDCVRSISAVRSVSVALCARHVEGEPQVDPDLWSAMGDESCSRGTGIDYARGLVEPRQSREPDIGSNGNTDLEYYASKLRATLRLRLQSDREARSGVARRRGYLCSLNMQTNARRCSLPLSLLR